MLIVGAGLSGAGSAEPGILARYPGARSDSDMHTLGYSLWPGSKPRQSPTGSDSQLHPRNGGGVRRRGEDPLRSSRPGPRLVQRGGPLDGQRRAHLRATSCGPWTRSPPGFPQALEAGSDLRARHPGAQMRALEDGVMRFARADSETAGATPPADAARARPLAGASGRDPFSRRCGGCRSTASLRPPRPGHRGRPALCPSLARFRALRPGCAQAHFRALRPGRAPALPPRRSGSRPILGAADRRPAGLSRVIRPFACHTRG